MIEDKVLGIPFFKFDLPDKDKVEDIYNVMQTLPFIPNDTNEIWAGGSDLYKNPDLRYLFDWMQDCMVEVSHSNSMGIQVCVSNNVIGSTTHTSHT